MLGNGKLRILSDGLGKFEIAMEPPLPFCLPDHVRGNYLMVLGFAMMASVVSGYRLTDGTGLFSEDEITVLQREFLGKDLAEILDGLVGASFTPI